MMAGMGMAGATQVRPSKLFASGRAAKQEKILVPASGHAAFASAGKTLATKLKLEESALRRSLQRFLDGTFMTILRLSVALLLASSASMSLAQTPVPAKEQAPGSAEPLIVDVHSSPYRSSIFYRANIGDRRFDMRDATLLDMITLAYKREDDAVIGGPSWIDFDRFDLAAKISSLKLPSFSTNPANSQAPQNPQDPYEQIRPVLQRVLAERFHLTFHMEDRPLPGYVMTVAKDGAKLAEAKAPDAPNNCQSAQDKATPGQFSITCTSETITQFLSMFGGVFPHPVIDRTGLKKSYDFTLKFSFDQIRTQDDYIRVYTDALKQQLGLVIAPGDVSQPAIVIDKVDSTPTPNPPDIAKLIPAQPDLEFEVATIKPTADNEPQDQIRPAGSQITFSGYTLQHLLVQAWQLATGAMLGNAPPWINQVRYTILVKLPPDVDGRVVFQDQDLLDNMLQKLLIDRFQIKYHWGEQTQDGWVLLADNPKMKKADPNSRTSCGYGPPPGEKDVRSTPDSPFDNESHCLNVTMDQFTDVLQNLTKSEIKNHVVNKTGLAGSYDITIYYTSTRKLLTDTKAAAATARQAGDDSAAAPVAGVSLQDYFRKQLGLRLEKQPTTVPALVLDHIEKTPTEN